MKFCISIVSCLGLLAAFTVETATGVSASFSRPSILSTPRKLTETAACSETSHEYLHDLISETFETYFSKSSETYESGSCWTSSYFGTDWQEFCGQINFSRGDPIEKIHVCYEYFLEKDPSTGEQAPRALVANYDDNVQTLWHWESLSFTNGFYSNYDEVETTEGCMDNLVIWPMIQDFLSTECRNTDESWLGDNGEIQSCLDIANLKNGRNKACKTSLYKDKCPGLCKRKKCSCQDYEYEFPKREQSTNLVACETLASDQCRFKRVAKNCPTLCDDGCAQ